MGNKKEYRKGNPVKKEVMSKSLSPEASQFIIDPHLLKYAKIAKEMVNKHQYNELSNLIQD